MNTAIPSFTPLEATVVSIACAERGRGFPPTGWRALTAALSAWFSPADRIRTLANPRLEALRLVANATYRRGGAGVDDFAAFIAAGFTQAHIGLLEGRQTSER